MNQMQKKKGGGRKQDKKAEEMKSGMEEDEKNKNRFFLVMLGYIIMIFIPLAFSLFPATLTTSLAFFGSISFLFSIIACHLSHPSFENNHF